jgi:hypothetical protein
MAQIELPISWNTKPAEKDFIPQTTNLLEWKFPLQ